MTELLSQPPSTLAWLRQTPADPARWRVWQQHVHRLRLLEAGEAASEGETEDDTAKPSQEPGARRPHPRPGQPAPPSQGTLEIQRQADILLQVCFPRTLGPVLNDRPLTGHVPSAQASCARAHPLTGPSIPSSLGSEVSGRGRHHPSAR